MMEAEGEKQQSQCVGLLKIKEPATISQATTIFGGTQPPLFGANFPQSAASSIEQLLLGPMAGRSALYSASAFLSMLQQRGAAAATNASGAHQANIANTQMVGIRADD